MAKRTAQLVVALAVLIAAVPPASSAPAEGPPAHALIQVFLEDLAVDVEELNRCGYDIAYVNRKAGTADLVVTPQDLDEIQAKGYAFTVLQVSRRGAAAFGARTEGAEQVEVDTLYKDLTEIRAFLVATETAYPAIAKRYSIGASNNARPMYAMKISDNVAVDEDEPVVFFNGQHHAREVMSTEVALDIIEYLTTRYATDPNVQRWVNGREIWIVPTVNPDGNYIVFNTDDFWRKNARDNNNNGSFDSGDGVDINRNYPFQWGGVCNGSSGNTSDETYRGVSSGSEPETQAIMQLAREQHPVFTVDYHSYAEEVYYAYGCDPTTSPKLSTIPGTEPFIARVVGEDFSVAARPGRRRPGLIRPPRTPTASTATPATGSTSRAAPSRSWWS